MEDLNFWWYIIAGIIYFLTRRKKKKETPSRPGTENHPPKSQRPKSFEELLREITEGTKEEREESETVLQEPVVMEHPKSEIKPVVEDNSRMEGERRAFTDEESRKIYEESIKTAEDTHVFERDKHYELPRPFRGKSTIKEKNQSFAYALKNGLLDVEEAKKAVIYAEIMKRKY